MDKRTVVEIGSWLGKSTRFFANNVENIICVDTWEGSAEHKIRIELKEILSNLYQLFISNCWEHRDKIIPIKEKSKIALPIIANYTTVDFIYIDGSHEEEDVRVDLNLSLKLFPKAIIVGDDWFWKNEYGEYPVQKAVKDVFKGKILIKNGCWVIDRHQLKMF